MGPRSFACFLLLAPAVAAQWSAVQHSGQDMTPNLEISLAPPIHPWPQVAAELGNLEESRESMENAMMNDLQSKFNHAAAEARHRIGDVIGRAMTSFNDPGLAGTAFHIRHAAPKSAAFLQQLPQESVGSSAIAVKVNVLPASPPDASLRTAIDDLEHIRSDREQSMLQSAMGDADALMNFVANELQAQLQDQVGAILGTASSKKMQATPSFRQSPAQTNVRVVPTDSSYPTVASMVQGMEQRRDAAESLVQKRILEKELDFLMACNSAIEEGLQGGVARIMAKYGPASARAAA